MATYATAGRCVRDAARGFSPDDARHMPAAKDRQLRHSHHMLEKARWPQREKNNRYWKTMPRANRCHGSKGRCSKKTKPPIQFIHHGARITGERAKKMHTCLKTNDFELKLSCRWCIVIGIKNRTNVCRLRKRDGACPEKNKQGGAQKMDGERMPEGNHAKQNREKMDGRCAVASFGGGICGYGWAFCPLWHAQPGCGHVQRDAVC